MSRNIYPRWSKTKQAWLEQLEKGPAVSHSTTGYYCRVLGWSAWQRDEDGNMVGSFEVLTDIGRAVLEQWRSGNTKTSASVVFLTTPEPRT